jgi:hypothetical protein
VDLSSLSHLEAQEVVAFLQSEARPKGLLSKLPWELVDCREHADAIVRLRFFLPENPQTPWDRYRFSIAMHLVDAKSKLLYRIDTGSAEDVVLGESDAVLKHDRMRDVMYRAWWSLVEDTRRVSP